MPKKWVSFSASDSKAIESTFQKLSEDNEEQSRLRKTHKQDAIAQGVTAATHTGGGTNDDRRDGNGKVPVNEDFLFDVDIDERELAPAYWLGPIYEVRRGSWFFQGSVSCVQSKFCHTNTLNRWIRSASM